MNKCKYLKLKLNHSLECKKQNKIINIKECSNCIYKEYIYKERKTKLIKPSKSEILNLEKNRFSVFTDDLDHCIICNKKRNHLHEIFYGRNRRNSMQYGFVLPLCFSCHAEMHRNKSWQEFWHIQGQLYFEKNIGSREDFIKVFGKSYVKGGHHE